MTLKRNKYGCYIEKSGKINLDYSKYIATKKSNTWTNKTEWKRTDNLIIIPKTK